MRSPAGAKATGPSRRCGLGIVQQSLREREAAELEIRRRQQLLQQLLDSAAEGLFGVDTDGRCTFINTLP